MPNSHSRVPRDISVEPKVLTNFQKCIGHSSNQVNCCMYAVGLETDTRAYFTGVTILISLPTGTKIFNWLSSYLGNPPFFTFKTNSAFFGLLFLLMFTIGGSTGIILGNAAVDLGLHDTYYVVAHFHFVLSLGAVIAIFSGIIFNGENIVGSKNLLPSLSSTLSLYHFGSTLLSL